MILIISIGESLLYFTVCFSFVPFHLKKKELLQDCFWVALFLLQKSIFSGLKNFEGRLSKSIFP